MNGDEIILKYKTEWINGSALKISLKVQKMHEIKLYVITIVDGITEKFVKTSTTIKVLTDLYGLSTIYYFLCVTLYLWELIKEYNSI